MFSFFKKKKEDDIQQTEVQEENSLEKSVLDDEAYANPVEIKEKEISLLEEQKVIKEEEKKGFFSRALEKTFATIKTVVPQKQEKISFEDIEELLIEADVEYEIIEKAMNGLPEEITRKIDYNVGATTWGARFTNKERQILNEYSRYRRRWLHRQPHGQSFIGSRPRRRCYR